MARTLLVDPSIAGISGNMLLGALVDLGAGTKPLEELAHLVSRELGCSVGLKRERVRRYGFGAEYVEWTIDTAREEVPGVEFLRNVKAMADRMELSREARELAAAAAEALLRAEAKVHDQAVEEVVFHELGSVDTVLDMVGVAALLDELDLLGDDTTVRSTPVVVGLGSMEARHGHLAVPPFVTAELLRSFSIPFRYAPQEGEFATPTGVAILGALADGFDLGGTLVPRAVGHGAGLRDVQGIPNILRMILSDDAAGEAEYIAVVETTVDDVTGEVIAYTAERLLGLGALDVQAIPTVGKKGRPGHILQVLAPLGLEARISEALMEETGSLGVRVDALRRRHILHREVAEVAFVAPGFEGTVRVKVARDARGRIVRLKPEFGDAREIATRTGLPLRRVLQEVERRAWEELGPPGPGGRGGGGG